jgi:hypothetical protein
VPCCRRATKPARLLPLLHTRWQALFEEAQATCDLTAEGDMLRCAHPVTMYLGDPPLLASRIYERWHGDAWNDQENEL